MFTFLFTDVEGSTRMWQESGDAMAAALARHDAILRALIPAHGGRVVKHTGDGCLAVFAADGALEAALELQRRLQAEDWSAVGDVRVRMGIAAGEAEERGGDFFGAAVNRAARVTDTAWGGQVVVAEEAAAAATLPPGASLLDLGVHALKDVGQPVRLFQLTHDDLRLRRFPPPRTLAAHPHNLPPPSTPFVGREQELASLRLLFASPECRWLTILGPGGMGKSRLALQLAAELRDEYEWGAWFVALAPLISPEQVPAATAAALRIPLGPGADAAAQVLTFLGNKELLLLFDNFEHLAPAASFAADIIRAAPAVKILTTSRARLRASAEKVYELGGMGVPALAADGEFSSYGAVRLFVERARALRPDFQLDAAARAGVWRVCRNLGGIPLAVELAASWIRTLDPAEIADEVERDRELLQAEGGDVADRHRSLRAVFDYSYGLLGGDERQALENLAVFAGGFTREAAAVAAGAGLAVLAALLDKSLVRRDPAGRYEIHELIRQYAAEKLAARPDGGEPVRDRHAAYYLGLAAALTPQLEAGRPAAFAAFGADIDNMRTAWERAAERDPGGLENALDGVATYYYEQGDSEELLRLAAAAQRAPAATPALAARLEVSRGMALYRLTRYDEAGRALRAGLTLARRAGLRRETVMALNNLADEAYGRGRHGRAERLSRMALRRAREIDFPRGVYRAATNLGQVARATGRPEDARENFERALAVGRASGHATFLSAALNNLGNLARTLGDFALARERYQEALETAQAAGNKRFISNVLNNLGLLAEHEGRDDDALAFYGQSLAAKRELNEPIHIITTLGNIAGLRIKHGDVAGAEALVREALALARATRLDGKIALCLNRLAEIHLTRREWGAHRAALREALARALAGNDRAMVIQTALSCADALGEAGRAEEAAALAAAFAPFAPSEIFKRIFREMAAHYQAGLPAEAFERARAGGEAAGWEGALALARAALAD